MHPQTLRMYEARGLIEPKRSPKGTRLYSHEDVERLRRIQEMTAELGMNLAGVERVFELEEQLEAWSARSGRSRSAPSELKAEVERLEELRRELRAEIVPYAKGGAIVRNADVQAVPSGYNGRTPGRSLGHVSSAGATAHAGRSLPAGRGDRPRRDEHGLPRHRPVARSRGGGQGRDRPAGRAEIRCIPPASSARRSAAAAPRTIRASSRCSTRAPTGPRASSSWSTSRATSLAEILREDRPARTGPRGRIAEQVADALSAATRPASSTATSSPATSWSRPGRAVKVLDFGIARALDGPR